MKKLRSNLTYANVMVTILAFLVLGGGAAFAAGQLAKNSVGAKQLKNNAVTTAKIKKAAVTGAKIKLSSLGSVPKADTATSATNAAQLEGTPGTGYQKRTMWALVNGLGTQIVAQSGGISIQDHVKGGTWLHFPQPVAGKAILASAWEGEEFGKPILQGAPCGFVNPAATPDSVPCAKGTNTTSDLFLEMDDGGAPADITAYVAVIP